MTTAGDRATVDDGRPKGVTSHAARSVNARIQTPPVWKEIVRSDQLPVPPDYVSPWERLLAWRRSVPTSRLIGVGALAAAAITALSLSGNPSLPNPVGGGIFVPAPEGPDNPVQPGADSPSPHNSSDGIGVAPAPPNGVAPSDFDHPGSRPSGPSSISVSSSAGALQSAGITPGGSAPNTSPAPSTSADPPPSGTSTPTPTDTTTPAEPSSTDTVVTLPTGGSTATPTP